VGNPPHRTGHLSCFPGYVEYGEKLVGKPGYMVLFDVGNITDAPGLFVRIKDGKALIASMPK